MDPRHCLLDGHQNTRIEGVGRFRGQFFWYCVHCGKTVPDTDDRHGVHPPDAAPGIDALPSAPSEEGVKVTGPSPVSDGLTGESSEL